MADIIFLNCVLHDELATVTIEDIHFQIRCEPAVCVSILRELCISGTHQKRGLRMLMDSSQSRVWCASVLSSCRNIIISDTFGAVYNPGVEAGHPGAWIIHTVQRKHRLHSIRRVALEVFHTLSQIRVIPHGIEITCGLLIFDNGDVSLNARVAEITRLLSWTISKVWLALDQSRSQQD